MCGIFGFSLNNKNINKVSLQEDISILYRLSESRGVEAAGLAIQKRDSISIFKKAIPAFKMSQTKEFKNFFIKALQDTDENKINLIAHSRLVTNGIQADNNNNQPASAKNIVCVHNGIITNIDKIIQKYPKLEILSKLDTEILIKLINLYYSEGLNLVEAIKVVYKEIEGYANIGLLDDDNNLILATDNGSLYYIEQNNNIVFASELYILKEYIKNSALKLFSEKNIFHLEAGTGIVICQDKIVKFNLTKKEDFPSIIISSHRKEQILIDDYDSFIEANRKSIKRCTKCILPSTMPFIKFDEHGVCNYCKNYSKKELLGKIKLEKRLEALRKADGSPDMIFAFSGGRDSSYALHYYVKELGLKPIAYSYDWGMVTDLGRRNQARLLGKLGVEHVIVSADLRMKRENIRKNVNAWLKKPDLGMIPLIIAGDKQMFYHAQQVQEHYGANAFMFSTNYLEKTDFKTGFANVNTIDLKGLSMALTNKNKYAMISHYLKNFITNPAYINTSLLDTFDAFKKYYDKKHNERIEFYDYIAWDEETVNRTIIDEYNWETSSDTSTTWRIGDGTAAFYNYIYHTVAGFTENDTFRSNQIREGAITREKALELIEIENQPRWKTIKEYCELIQVDFVKAIEVIDSIPKLYIKD